MIAGQVVGLDIGCGANLIYPLLGAAVHGWKFVAVDVTDVAMAGARANAALNPHLVHLIEVSMITGLEFTARMQPAPGCSATEL